MRGECDGDGHHDHGDAGDGDGDGCGDDDDGSDNDEISHEVSRCSAQPFIWRCPEIGVPPNHPC